MNDTRIGIIGGMGPEATANFFMKLVKMTNVNGDQDHFRIIIDNNPKIPDRTKAILYGGESPSQEIIHSAKGLELLGVEIACIPCMTSHYFIEEVQEAVDYRIINIFEELGSYIEKAYRGLEKVGVLATSGSVKIDLFSKYLQGKEVIYPKADVQEKMVMEAIYGKNGIKSGNLDGEPVKHLVRATESLMEDGAEAVILGCTEIGLALKQIHSPIPIIDPLDIAARVLTQQL